MAKPENKLAIKKTGFEATYESNAVKNFSSFTGHTVCPFKSLVQIGPDIIYWHL